LRSFLDSQQLQMNVVKGGTGMTTIEITYLAMIIVPTVILGIMLFLGFDSGVDADVGVDVDVDVGDVDIGDVDVGDMGGPGFLSLRLVMAFIMGFGLDGYLSLAFLWIVPHWVCGIIGGALVYFLVYQVLKLLYKQQANTQVSHASFTGLSATVSVKVAVGKVGEIKVTDPKTGLLTYMMARAYLPDDSFDKNEPVRIRRIDGDIARVVTDEIDVD